MPSAPASRRLLRFGVFEVDLASGELRKSGVKIKVQDLPFRFLAVLLERPGEVVTREELRETLWTDGIYVDFDRSLNAAVSRIRDALSDSAESPRFIETLPRRGYRFVAPVESHGVSVPAAQKGDALAADPGRKRARVYGLAAAGAGLLALLVVVLVASGILPSRDREGAVHQSAADLPDAKPSVVVLPFTNLNQDGSDYFSDGMTDALIVDLGTIKSIRVISRTSSVRYRETGKSLSQIAKELKVTHVVEGSVLRAADKVQITAQLADAVNDTQLWSRKYQRRFEDILALQTEITQDIAGGVQVELSTVEQRQFAQRQAVNPDAHEAYLKGLHLLQKRSGEALSESVDHFREAIKKDPTHAHSYVGLANAYIYLSTVSVGTPPRDWMPKAKKAAVQAVRLDATSADGHAALGAVRMRYDYDWEGAETELQRAIRLNRSHAAGHNWYARYLLTMGRSNEALAEQKVAQELDPLSIHAHALVGWQYYMQQDYEHAIGQLSLTVQLDPKFGLGHSWLGTIYAESGRFQEALAEFETALSISDEPATKAWLAYTYARMGNGTDARALLEELHDLSRQKYVPPIFAAWIYAALGDRDGVFQQLEQAYEDRAPNLIYLKSAPPFQEFRSDPRFQALLKKMNFPE